MEDVAMNWQEIEQKLSTMNQAQLIEALKMSFGLVERMEGELGEGARKLDDMTALVRNMSRAKSSSLADVFDAHVAHEFVDKDVEATMQTMTPEPYLLHLPTLTGGEGHAAVRRFYEQVFVGKWPADTHVTRVSRTVGTDQVADELLISFTHDVPMEFLLPGVAPTGRQVDLPFVVVMKFEEGKIAHEHIYWDQGSLLAQVGLIDAALLPVIGVQQAEALRFKRAA
jgi:carboxymethylenebutenolidase